MSLLHAESLFLAGDPQRADALATALFPSAADTIEAASIHKLRSRIHEFQGNLPGAIDEIRKGLVPFGLVLPESQEEIQRRIGEGLGKLQGGLARTPIETLVNLPEMTDAERLMAMRLLAQVVPAAIQMNYALYMVATMMMMDLTLIRTDDFIVRWGGEEFLVILNNTDPRYLERFARKVLTSVRDASVRVSEETVINRTSSVGYAQIPFSKSHPNLLTLEQTIKLSDHAMYIAKRNGRNRAVAVSINEDRFTDDAVKDALRTLSPNADSVGQLLSVRQVFDLE